MKLTKKYAKNAIFIQNSNSRKKFEFFLFFILKFCGQKKLTCRFAVELQKRRVIFKRKPQFVL